MVDTSDLYARGLRRRKKMFGDADVEKRMAAAGEFGAPLQNVINAYVYGDVWERDGLADNIRSLVMLGITAASGKPTEFAVHAKGALANGCTRAQVQDVLLLIAMYCGRHPGRDRAQPDRGGGFRSGSAIGRCHEILKSWRQNPGGSGRMNR